MGSLKVMVNIHGKMAVRMLENLEMGSNVEKENGGNLLAMVLIFMKGNIKRTKSKVKVFSHGLQVIYIKDSILRTNVMGKEK
jgi:hypothetical protein